MPKLKDIIGHENQLKELEMDVATDNIAHAYLFSGPRHLGKMTCAQRFAFELLAMGLEGDERKKAQRDVEKLTHPDLLVLDQLWMDDVQTDWDVIAKTSNVPLGHRAKTKVKTDTIGIDDIRAMQERLIETGVGTWRCCIIRSVERMKKEAANAFLKILEEPPQGLVFLLTTQKRSSLLPTIVSRTRTIPFHPLSAKELKPLLDECSEDDRRFILHLAQGAPGIVRLLCNDPDALRLRRQIHSKALSFWKTSSLRERIQLLSPLAERGTEADEFILHLALALRDETPEAAQKHTSALSALVRSLQTNTHRGLLAQQFALSVS